MHEHDQCPDCGEPLRAGDDVRCVWCADNRLRRPQDYAWPSSQPEAERLAG